MRNAIKKRKKDLVKGFYYDYRCKFFHFIWLN